MLTPDMKTLNLMLSAEVFLAVPERNRREGEVKPKRFIPIP